MLVTTQNEAHGVTGLHVGESNVRRYFPNRVSVIELQLDHLSIQCRLDPSFWQDDPVIRDPRLCTWLEARHLHRTKDRAPVSLVLVPIGNNAFQVQALSLTAHARVKPAQSPAAGARIVL
jgi:hypothetical protein